MNRIKAIILTVCCLLIGGGMQSAFAQNDDDYNPANPAEPGRVECCRIRVSADPAEGATVSGGGKYSVVSGGRVYISTSTRNSEDYTYEFKYWTKNGAIYSYSRGFYFYTEDGTFDFVAHYDKKDVIYDPSSPQEPSSSSIKRKYYLYINSTLDEACSFNRASGDKIAEGTSIYLRTYPNPYYEFKGWRVNGKIINTSTSFYYTMLSANTTIEAVYSELEYNPDNPLEPSGGNQGNVQNGDSYIIGDLNRDGKVSLSDLTALIDILSGHYSGYDLNAADTNSDGDITIDDKNYILNMLTATE